MKKRLLALLLALVMAVGLLPTAALAAETPATVTDAAGLSDALAAGGEIALGGDFTVSETLTIDKAVTLDLAGHTLTAAASGGVPSFQLFQVESGGEFIIRDSGAGGKLQAAEPDPNEKDVPLTKLVYNMTGGKFWLQGGTLAAGGKYDTAVEVTYDATGASFLMTGGAIIGNGTGIYLRGRDNVVVVTGGEVKSLEDNALYVDGASYAYIGGDVETGGDLNNSRGTLTVTGGNHDSTLYSGSSNNYSTSPTTKIYGGTFCGVSQNTYGTMELYGGDFCYIGDYSFKTKQPSKTLKDYIAEGAKCVEPGDEADILDYIDSNQVMSAFRIIKPEGCAPQLVGIFGGSHGTVTAGETTLDNTNRLITDGLEVTADADAGYASQVDTSKDGVILVTFLPGEPSHTSAHKHAVSVACETEGEDLVTFLPLTSVDGALYIDGVAESTASDIYLLPEGNYYLAGDVSLDKTLCLSGTTGEQTVNLCLNGHKLEYTGGENNKNVIQVGTRTYTFNICDCDGSGGSHTITSPVTGESVTISGGLITGGTSSGIKHGGTKPVTLYGGTIAGNGTGTGYVYGGGVNANYFEMHGGAITHNKAYWGGGVDVGVTLTMTTFTMTGGEISGNWATGKVGGVSTVIYNGTPSAVNLSGSPVITGNVAGEGENKAPANLYLVNGCTVSVTGLGQAASVGVSTETAPTASTPVTVAVAGEGYTITADDLAKFSSDNSDYELKLENGEILLYKPHVHKWAMAWVKTDDTHHWHNCSNSGCTITDNSQKEGYGEHTFAWKYSDTDTWKHWMECTVCGKGKDHSTTHVLVESITKQPTCTEPGTKEKRCACGYVKATESIPARHTLSKTDAVAASCTAFGVQEYWSCTVCGKYYADAQGANEITDLDAWKAGDGKVEKADHTWGATYEKDAGQHWKKCTVQGCDATDTKADHVYDDDQDAECNTCGYTRAVTPPDPGHTHTWATTWEKNATHHWHECTADGCDVTANADKNGYAAHVWDEGVVTTPPTVDAEGVKTYTCTVCAATKTETVPKLDPPTPDDPTFAISGTVTDHEGNGVTATVTLTQGSAVIATAQTDAQGNYSFANVPAGLYNVAAERDGVTKTILVELTDANATEKNIQMPEGKTNSVVEVKGEDTPAAVVGGVDAVAEAQEVTSGQTVTVKLTVEAKEAPADKVELDTVISGKKDDVLYLDLSLLKTTTVQGSDTPTEEPIPDTGDKVLEIVVPYDFTGKKDVTVYRKHSTDSAAALTKLTAKPTENFTDGSFYADGVGKVYIYASKFSTYAIGYTEETTSPVNPSRPSSRPSRRPTQTQEPAWPFVDVTEQDWHYEGVKYVYEKELMEGTSDTTFAPDMTTSRAMIATILWRLAGSPEPKDTVAYTDCNTESYYAKAVAWAAESGVVEGYGNGKFGPDDPITREQLAAMLYRYADSPTTTGTLDSFTDSGKAGSWATDALRWAVEQGILTGKGGGILDPAGHATRAEAAAMLQRFCKDKG